MFDTLDDAQLKGACGGINMRLTQYGWRDDPNMDSYTRRGLGKYRHLSADSIALTDSGLRALGISRRDLRRHEQWVDVYLKGGGVLHRRIDDRAPERRKIADLYMPQGFDRSLGDYADIRRA